MARAAAGGGDGLLPLDDRDQPPERDRRGGARRAASWMQLYCFRDRGVTRALLDEAIAAGFEAILLTVDAPYAGRRERDFRTGFEVPAEVRTPGDRGGGRAARPDRRRGLRAGRSLARLGRPRGAGRRVRAAGPGQGAGHRRGRRARGRARRRRRGRLQPRRPPARRRAGDDRRAARGGRGGRRPGPGADGRRDPPRHRRRRSRSRSAPTRSWSAGRRCGASPPTARPGAELALRDPRRGAAAGAGAARLPLAGDRPSHVRRLAPSEDRSSARARR